MAEHAAPADNQSASILVKVTIKPRSTDYEITVDGDDIYINERAPDGFRERSGQWLEPASLASDLLMMIRGELREDDGLYVVASIEAVSDDVDERG
jgi:hypothetical protein